MGASKNNNYGVIRGYIRGAYIREAYIRGYIRGCCHAAMIEVVRSFICSCGHAATLPQSKKGKVLFAAIRPRGHAASKKL